MIESLMNDKIKYTNKLKQKKYRSIYKEFLIEGEHLLVEAIKTKNVIRIFTTEDKQYNNIETYQISEQVMQKLSVLGESQGVIAICKKPDVKPLKDRILVLDQIQDPGNMGTLIRTAVAFGFSTIIAENSVDYYNEKVIRSSQGNLFYIDLIERDIEDFILKNPEYHYYGTSVINAKPLDEIKFIKKPFAIILGNEGCGVRDKIQKLVNTNITIPMINAESLNVAIAGGIIMYTLTRREE